MDKFILGNCAGINLTVKLKKKKLANIRYDVSTSYCWGQYAARTSQ